MSFPFALLASALTGWIALSYEIVWARVFSFASAGRANSFGLLLAAYLLGLALGALLSRRLREANDPDGRSNVARVAWIVLVSNLVGALVVPTVAELGTHIWYRFTYLVVVPAAAALGVAFPLLCHAAVPPDDNAGARTAQLYVANIVGSVAGSLSTGFVLMDTLTLVQLSAVLVALGVALSALLALYSTGGRGARGRQADSGSSGRRAGLVVGGAVVIGAGAVFATPWLLDRVWEKLQFGREYPNKSADAATALGADARFLDVHESKSGVITVGQDLRIFGGGVYDGALKTNLEVGGWLVRPYALSYLHPAPKRVLMIGLSGGAWANIIAGNPSVESVTAIEINPGYLDVIARHSEVAPILQHPKLQVVMDDGRRWLVRNPDARFDLIVANTTFHWRSFATNLLSVEFQTLVRDHLAPGGVYLYNTTGSRDAAATSASVFPHAMMIINNVVGSIAPLSLDVPRWRAALEGTTLRGAPAFPAEDRAARAALEWLLATPAHTNRPDPVLGEVVFRDRAGLLEWAAGGRVITDDNMISEW